MARFVFQQACMWVHDRMRVWAAPIALRRYNRCRFMANTASDIAPWCLKIPVFCDHVEKYLLPNSRFNRPKYEVIGSVSWTDAGQHKTISISCQPEKQLLTPHSFWQSQPFGHIRRSAWSGECNCDLRRVSHKTMLPCDNEEFKRFHISDVEAFVTSIPCIVNYLPVKCGTEIILLSDS